jgi:hypothetical protein
LGLFSVSFGQKDNKKTVVDSQIIEVIRTINQNQPSSLSGVIVDPAGAVITGTKLRLYKKGEKKILKINSDAEGNYIFKPLSAGVYVFETRAQGFKKYKVVSLEIKDNEKIQYNIVLQPDGNNFTVGIFTSEPLIDTTSSGITTKFTRKQIENLPY